MPPAGPLRVRNQPRPADDREAVRQMAADGLARHEGQDGKPTGLVELPVEWILDDAPLFDPRGQRYMNPRNVARPRDTLNSDRHIVELAVAELNSQKTTYEAVGRRLKEDVPDLDGLPGLELLATFRARLARARVAQIRPGDVRQIARHIDLRLPLAHLEHPLRRPGELLGIFEERLVVARATFAALVVRRNGGIRR